MRILATGRMKTDRPLLRQRQRGVSLVEILVVLMLAAMVAGVVIVSAPPARSDMREEAERLAARLDFAAQEAITKGSILGMVIGEGGYEFYRYNRGEWNPETTAQLASQTFSPDYSVTVSLAETAKENERDDPQRQNEVETVIRPDLQFTPVGETTPVTVTFQDRRETWRVIIDGAGHVEMSDEDGA